MKNNRRDERIASIEANELGQILEAYWEMYDQEHPYIYLDEIQNITGWEKFARRLTEAKHHVMITGSNAKMLSREVMSTLGGSCITVSSSPGTRNASLQKMVLTLR